MSRVGGEGSGNPCGKAGRTALVAVVLVACSGPGNPPDERLQKERARFEHLGLKPADVASDAPETVLYFWDSANPSSEPKEYCRLDYGQVEVAVDHFSRKCTLPDGKSVLIPKDAPDGLYWKKMER